VLELQATLHSHLYIDLPACCDDYSSNRSQVERRRTVGITLGLAYNEGTVKARRLSNPPFIGDRVFALLGLALSVTSFASAAQEFRNGYFFGLTATATMIVAKVPIVPIFFSLRWGFVYEVIVMLFYFASVIYFGGPQNWRFVIQFAFFAYALLRLGGIIKPSGQPEISTSN
jgi:hypothetical protein